MVKKEKEEKDLYENLRYGMNQYAAINSSVLYELRKIKRKHE